MKDHTKRALEIANSTDLDIIESEIEDWEKAVKATDLRISQLKTQMKQEQEKLGLWLTARIYKKQEGRT